MKQCLGERRGITRYGSFRMPMDETLAVVDLDISGRPYLVFHCDFRREQIGAMSTEMVQEFLRAFAFAAGITLHVNVLYGENDHHKAEAIFKALARALKQAVLVSGTAIPSSKGMLE
jgi:imidazoleglycerol-phosphate dehydratase